MNLKLCFHKKHNSQQGIAKIKKETSQIIPKKREFLLFQLREFGGLQLLFGFNASRLCPCTLGWCRSCRDSEVFNVIWWIVHCEPQTKKKVKDHQTTQNQEPNLKAKVSKPSPISFLSNLGSLLQGLQCCADGGAVWSTSSGATGDMQRSRLRILREPGGMEMWKICDRMIWEKMLKLVKVELMSWLFVLCFRKRSPKSYRWMWVSIGIWLDTWW